MYQGVFVRFTLLIVLSTDACYVQGRSEDFNSDRSSPELKANVSRTIFSVLREDSARQTGGNDGTAAKRVKRQVLANSKNLWPHAIVPYIISYTTDGRFRRTIRKAMLHLELHTCVQFIRANKGDKNVLVIKTDETVCESDVGMVGNEQVINVHKYACNYGNIVHELMHTLGFFHEQMRPDRDKYIHIIEENIIPEELSQFSKGNETLMTSMGDEFDINSILQYGSKAFSSNGLITIEPIVEVPNQHMGQRVQMSKGDREDTNKLYKCPFCGKKLVERIGDFGVEGENASDVYCEWRIAASYGNRVRFKILWLDLPYDETCYNDYLDIRDDERAIEPFHAKYCGNAAPWRTFTSKGNRLTARLRIRRHYGHYRGFKIEYEKVCGGSFRSEDGRIESPEYPYQYPDVKMNCIWTIVTPRNTNATITFEYFEMDKCPDDYVLLYDGRSGEELGRLDGYYFFLMQVVSNSNVMKIHFVTTGDHRCDGFTSTYYGSSS